MGLRFKFRTQCGPRLLTFAAAAAVVASFGGRRGADVQRSLCRFARLQHRGLFRRRLSSLAHLEYCSNNDYTMAEVAAAAERTFEEGGGEEQKSSCRRMRLIGRRGLLVSGSSAVGGWLGTSGRTLAAMERSQCAYPFAMRT